MKIKLPSFHFDQDLRDIPESRDEWESFLADLKNQLKIATDEEIKLQLFESIGNASRILMKLDEAEKFLLKAVDSSKNISAHSRHVQNLIRLAHVYQC